MLRTSLDPSSIAPAVRQAVWDVDPHQAVGQVVTMQQLVDKSLRSHSLVAWLVGAFAAVALLLAAVGVYGVTSFGVVRQTQEIGIRMALGACRTRVLRAVLIGALTYVAGGVIVGIPLAISAGAALRSFLFGIQPHDTLTLTLVCAFILIAAGVAAYGPARRASRVDPLIALRAE